MLNFDGFAEFDAVMTSHDKGIGSAVCLQREEPNSCCAPSDEMTDHVMLTGRAPRALPASWAMPISTRSPLRAMRIGKTKTETYIGVGRTKPASMKSAFP